MHETRITAPQTQKFVITETDRIECDFLRYLKDERGLSQATLDNYLPVVRTFLFDRFGCSNIVLDEIKPFDISKFIIHHAKNKANKTAQLMTTALRVFFRFLISIEEISQLI